MPTLQIQGIGSVTVGDNFASLSPEQQTATVDEIIASVQNRQKPATAADVSPAQAEAATARMAQARQQAGVADETGVGSLLARNIPRALGIGARSAADTFTGAGGGVLEAAALATERLNRATGFDTAADFWKSYAASVPEARRELRLTPDQLATGDVEAALGGQIAAGGLATIPLATVGGPAAAAGVGAYLGAGQGAARASDFGATPEQIMQAALAEGAVGGVTNVIPGLPRGAAPTVGRQLAGAGLRTGFEAVQGAAGQLGSNIAEQQIYNPDRPTMEGVGLAASLSGLTRAGFEAPGLVAGAARSIGEANVQREADRIDLEAMQARTAAAEAAQAAEQAQRDAVSRMIAQQYAYEPGPTPRSQEPPIVSSSETDVFTDAQARADAVQQLQDQRVLEQQRAANRQVYPDEPGPALPSERYEPPRPPEPLTPKEQARLTRLNAERIIGGERPVTEEEFRAMGTSGPKEPAVVGAYSADNIIEPTMRMTEGGVVERVQPQAQEVQAPTQIQGQAEGVPAQVRQVEGAPQRVDQQLGTGEVRPGGVVDSTIQGNARKLVTGEGTQELGSVLPPAAQRAIQQDFDRVLSEFKGLFGPTAKKYGGRIASVFRSRGDLPESVVGLNDKRMSRIQKDMTSATFAARDVEAQLRRAYQSVDSTPPEVMDAVNRFMRGQADVSSLPQDLQATVARMRDHVDTLSRELIDSGAAAGDLAMTIEKNRGVYLTRTYKQFTDPKWSDKVPEEIINKAAAFFRKENPSWTDEQVHSEIRRYLARDDTTGAFIKNGGKLGSKDLSIFKQRKDIPPEIRALWGEETNPFTNYTRSVAKMSHLIANDQFLKEVRQDGMGKYLFPADKSARPEGFDTEIVGKESDNLKELAGLLTSKEIKRAFEEQVAQAPVGPMMKRYMAAVGYTKAAKTILSPQSHIRNFLGNPMLLIANGNWNIAKNFKTASASALARLGIETSGINRQKWRDAFLRYVDLGVVDKTARAGEIEAVLRPAMGGDLENFSDLRTLRASQKVGRFAADAYQAGDEVWRIMTFEAERQKYAKAFPEWTDAQLDAKAADIVKATMPTYSRVPKAVRAVGRSPLVGDFVSFPAEMIRNNFRRLQLIAEEMNDPRTRTIGANRAAGMATALTAPAMATAMMMYILGVDQEKVDAARRFVPAWSENSNLTPVFVDKDGVPQFVDTSYVDPMDVLKKPFMAVMRGDDPKDALTNGLYEMFSPFLSEGMLTGTLIDVSRNQKDTGGRIYNPQDDFADQIADRVEYLWRKALEPGAISSARKIGKDPLPESIALITGQRRIDPAPRKNLPFKARDFARGSRDASALLSEAVRESAEDGASLAAAYERANGAHRRLFDELRKDVQAAEALGLDRREVYNILNSNGVSRRNLDQVLLGVYEPYQPSREVLGRLSPEGRQAVIAAYNQARQGTTQ